MNISTGSETKLMFPMNTVVTCDIFYSKTHLEMILEEYVQIHFYLTCHTYDANHTFDEALHLRGAYASLLTRKKFQNLFSFY